MQCTIKRIKISDIYCQVGTTLPGCRPIHISWYHLYHTHIKNPQNCFFQSLHTCLWNPVKGLEGHLQGGSWDSECKTVFTCSIQILYSCMFHLYNEKSVYDFNAIHSSKGWSISSWVHRWSAILSPMEHPGRRLPGDVLWPSPGPEGLTETLQLPF